MLKHSPNQSNYIMITKELVSHIRLVKKPERTFAYIRNVGPYMGDQALFTRLFSKVVHWARVKNLMRPELETITIYHDDPEAVPAENQRISVGVTVPDSTKPDGDIQIMQIPPGDFVVGSFEIDPEDYGLAWQHVIEWIINQKMDFLLEPMYESYRNNPRKHPEGKHLVDICVPIETY